MGTSRTNMAQLTSCTLVLFLSAAVLGDGQCGMETCGAGQKCCKTFYPTGPTFACIDQYSSCCGASEGCNSTLACCNYDYGMAPGFRCIDMHHTSCCNHGVCTRGTEKIIHKDGS